LIYNNFLPHPLWRALEAFGDSNWRTDFTPDRIAIIARDGSTIAEPRLF
jgi:hypothetical protein